MSYDGGVTWSSGPLAAFETHLVMDNQAQVFTYNWHWLTNTNANGAIKYPKSSPPTAASLPSSVCMRAWLAQVGSEESTGLEETCFDLNTTWVSTDAEADAIAAGGVQGGAAVGASDAPSTHGAAVGDESHSSRPSRPCPNPDGCGHRDTPAPSKGSKSDEAALSATLLFGNWTVACSRSLSVSQC